MKDLGRAFRSISQVIFSRLPRAFSKAGRRVIIPPKSGEVYWFLTRMKFHAIVRCSSSAPSRLPTGFSEKLLSEGSTRYLNSKNAQLRAKKRVEQGSIRLLLTTS